MDQISWWWTSIWPWARTTAACSWNWMLFVDEDDPLKIWVASEWIKMEKFWWWLAISVSHMCDTEIYPCGPNMTKISAPALGDPHELPWKFEQDLSLVVLTGMGQLWVCDERLGYGYKQWEFCWVVSRYADAVAENPTTIDNFWRFFASFQAAAPTYLNPAQQNLHCL